MKKHGFLKKILLSLPLVLALNTLNPIVNEIVFQANSQERFVRQELVCSQIALARAYELDNGKEANRAALGTPFINSGEILPRGRALGLNNVYVIKAGRHSGIVPNEGFSHEGLVGLLRDLKSGAHAHLVFIYKARQPGLGEFAHGILITIYRKADNNLRMVVQFDQAMAELEYANDPIALPGNIDDKPNLVIMPRLKDLRNALDTADNVSVVADDGAGAAEAYDSTNDVIAQSIREARAIEEQAAREAAEMQRILELSKHDRGGAANADPDDELARALAESLKLTKQKEKVDLERRKQMAAGAIQASEDELVQRAMQASLMTDALPFQVDELALFYTIEAFKEEARAKGILDFLTEEQIREAALTNMRAAR